MFLGYIDDSSDQKHKKVEALTAVLVHDKKFHSLESSLAIAVANIIPDERIHEFEEFKAWELYHGCGIFDGIGQEARFSAIRHLLGTISVEKIPVVYGAVDTSAMAKKHYASASPTDTAFRLCVPVISMVMTEQAEDLVQHRIGALEHGLGFGFEYALLISDYTDKNKRDLLRKTFREFRTQLRPPHWGSGLWYLHDEMYFGDSKDSVGLQLADVACYFIRKHLEGDDQTAEEFYNIFQERIVYGQIVPEDSEKAKLGIQRLRANNI